MRDIVVFPHAWVPALGRGQDRCGVLNFPGFFQERLERAVPSSGFKEPAQSCASHLFPPIVRASRRHRIALRARDYRSCSIPRDLAARSARLAVRERCRRPWLTDRFYLETSLFTHHFSYDPAHVNKQKLILGEWNITEQWLVGASTFDNSFGQSSQYVYGGWRYRPFEDVAPFYVKVSAGLTHGYRGQYQATRSRSMVPASRRRSFHRLVFAFRESAPKLVLFGGAGF